MKSQTLSVDVDRAASIRSSWSIKLPVGAVGGWLDLSVEIVVVPGLVFLRVRGGSVDGGIRLPSGLEPLARGPCRGDPVANGINTYSNRSLSADKVAASQ